jgi:hypothetical protein
LWLGQITDFFPGLAQIAVAQESIDADVLAPVLGKIFSSARPKNLRSPRNSWRGLAALGGRLNRPSGDPPATPTSVRESLQPSPEFKGAQGLAKCAAFPPPCPTL